jgi:glycyl-tRNA synthetase (class II)
MYEPLPPAGEQPMSVEDAVQQVEKRTVANIGKRAIVAVVETSRAIDEIVYATMMAGLFGEY